MKLAILELLDRAAREGREVVLVTDLASGAQAVIEGGARVAGDLVSVSYTHLTLPTIYSV